jgi:hypothetical protein
MIKFFPFFSLLLFYSLGFGQNVGISPNGLVPNSSAALDINFHNKGFLPPRIALLSTTDTLTVIQPAAALLVFNTNTAGTGSNAVSPGYYYNAGSPQTPQWKRLIVQSDVDGSETILSAGSNVSISGSGTAQNPYVISGTGGGGFSHYIGEAFGGGVIFHLWKDAQGVEHGLVVELDNQPTNHLSSSSHQIGITARSTWDGNANSTAIANHFGGSTGAAAFCLNLNSGGFSDWYLPSIDELKLLHTNRFNVNQTIAGIQQTSNPNAIHIGETGYWSSTEKWGSVEAWWLWFGEGRILNTAKTGVYAVRAIRKF